MQRGWTGRGETDTMHVRLLVPLKFKESWRSGPKGADLVFYLCARDCNTGFLEVQGVNSRRDTVEGVAPGPTVGSWGATGRVICLRDKNGGASILDTAPASVAPKHDWATLRLKKDQRRPLGLGVPQSVARANSAMFRLSEASLKKRERDSPKPDRPR